MRSEYRWAVALVVGVAAIVLLAGLPGAARGATSSTAPTPKAMGGALALPSAPSPGAAALPLTGASAKWFNLTAGLNPSPSGRFGGEMAYDAKDGYILMYGGTNVSSYPFTDTWTYKSGAWTQVFPALAPSARLGQIMVYDPVDQCVVLFGGERLSPSGVLGDTWEYAGGVWTNVTSSTGPAPRVDASAEWDPDVQSVVLFGGQNTSTALGDTWRFVGGTWTELFPASSPSPRVASALTYDAADGYLLLFGGASYTANFADTYKFANGTWTELFPASAPVGRAVWQSVYDTSLGAVLVFGGGVGNDSLYFGDTWTFHAGQWTDQFPVSSPSARQFNAMAWDPADDYAFTFAGQGETSNHTAFLLADAWAYVAAPTATVVRAAGPDDVGQTVGLSVAITGGVPPYSVGWTYGDGMGGTGMAAHHAYGSAGTFPVLANVTDSFDEYGIGQAQVTVYATPTIVVTVNVTAPVSRENLTVSGVVTGGAPPLTYAWSFGDGRTSALPGPFRLAYNATGSYTVNLTVTDGAGVSASGIASFTVQAPPSVANSGGAVAWTWIGIGVVLVVVAAVAVLALRRRRRPPSPPAGASPPTGWTPPPPPPANR